MGKYDRHFDSLIQTNLLNTFNELCWRLSPHKNFSVDSTTFTIIKHWSDLHSRMTPHNPPFRARYSVSFVSYTKKKKDRFISRVHCIGYNWWLSWSCLFQKHSFTLQSRRQMVHHNGDCRIIRHWMTFVTILFSCIWNSSKIICTAKIPNFSIEIIPD